MIANILILENNHIQAQTLADCINDFSNDLKIRIATSLSEAFDIVNKVTFKAFFLDISMDDTMENTDGLKFAIYLSKHDKTKHIPIIFVTGYPEHTYSAINKLHCFAYILKPYSKADVHKQLSDIFSEQISNSTISIRTLDGIYIKLNLNDSNFALE